MDPNLIYAKTPTGDEAVRQSTRVVQRNLRMVLVQVDGKMSAGELAEKIGNPRLVETALRELENGGFIAPAIDAVSVWEESKRAAREQEREQLVAPPTSEFSSFGPKVPSVLADVDKPQSAASNFSSFGKPILPARTIEHTKIDRQEAPSSEPSESAPVGSGDSVRLRRLLAPSLVIGVAAFFAGVFLFPYERFKPDLETSAAILLNAPVSIGEVGISVFPAPQLKLKDIRIGNPVDSTIDELRVGSLLAMLGGAPRRISRIEGSGVNFAANRLVAMPMFGGEAATNSRMLIGEIRIDGLQVGIGNDQAMRDLRGEVRFRDDGTLAKARFETADRGLLVSVLPGKNEIGLEIEGRAWKPVGSPVAFSALQAKGRLMENRLLIENIDTVALGGILRGSWRLDWENELTMAGTGELLRLDSAKVAAAFAPVAKIEGELSGELRLRARGGDWKMLWTDAEMTLNSEIVRGVFSGADLGEAVRRGSGAEVRAGSTKFDRLRSTLNISPNQISVRNIKLDAGMMTGTGQLVAYRYGEVEGTVAVTLSTSVSSVTAPVRVYGTLPDLTATSRK